MKRALITGASSGLGLAIGHQLTNTQVFNLSRSDSPFTDIQGDLSTDISDIELPSDIDLLILNAGIMPREPIGEIHNIQEVFSINVDANIQLTNRLLPSLKQRPSDIVIIGSTAAFQPTGDNAVYSASKAALDAYTKSLDKELQGFDIRVMVFHPGRFTSNLREQNKPASMNPEYLAKLIVHAIEMPRDMQLSQAIITRNIRS